MVSCLYLLLSLRTYSQVDIRIDTCHYTLDQSIWYAFIPFWGVVPCIVHGLHAECPAFHHKASIKYSLSTLIIKKCPQNTVSLFPMHVNLTFSILFIIMNFLNNAIGFTPQVYKVYKMIECNVFHYITFFCNFQKLVCICILQVKHICVHQAKLNNRKLHVFTLGKAIDFIVHI